jgi:hypothetical protein
MVKIGEQNIEDSLMTVKLSKCEMRNRSELGKRKKKKGKIKMLKNRKSYSCPHIVYIVCNQKKNIVYIV